jgi:hypothetical protein
MIGWQIKKRPEIWDAISKEIHCMERKICMVMSRYILRQWLKLEAKSLVSFCTMEETQWTMAENFKFFFQCVNNKGIYSPIIEGWITENEY